MGQSPESHAPTNPAGLGSFIARLVSRIERFWQQLSEGLEIQVLWGQFVAEARASYSLYSREVDWDALRQESGFRRFLKVSRVLFWAMLLKLSPARRVFFFLALVLTVLSFSIQTQRPERGLPPGGTNVSVNIPPIVPVGMLVVLLALELADRVIMKRDLEIAREIQRWLVPEVPPQVSGADIAFISRPANTVGGDYYDAFLLDGATPSTASPHLLLAVADVAGKSVPAALLMATFQASLRSLAGPSTPLRELVTRMNLYSCAHSLGGRRFTTAFFADLDPTSHTLTFVGAGQNAPILRRASGQLERLEAGSLPLGIDASTLYETSSMALAPGDLLVIFTDGLIEAVNEAGEEYGEARLLEVVKSTPRESAEKTLSALLAAVDGFAGRAPQHDDITCLIVRVP